MPNIADTPHLGASTRQIGRRMGWQRVAPIVLKVDSQRLLKRSLASSLRSDPGQASTVTVIGQTIDESFAQLCLCLKLRRN